MKQIIRDFLARLLPWQGTEETTYKSIWIRGPAPDGSGKVITWGHATRDLDELVEIAWFYTKKDRNVYFGCGSQRAAAVSEHGGKWAKSIRAANNMVSYKSIWLDLDCGPTKDYPDRPTALKALIDFCDIAELPYPNQLVNSGNGLHVYWVTDLPLPVATWSMFANALDVATRKHGLKCDNQCTIDAARILRVPGTLNHKANPPLPIEMGQPGPEYSHAFLEQALNQYAGPQPYKGPRQQAHEYTEMAKKFMEGLAPTHSDPVDLLAIADAGCLVLGEAFDTAGRDHKQPLWHLLMLAATFDKDPRNAAHMMSDGYPSYDPNEVEEMLARKQNEKKAKNLGWPSCYSFSKLSPLCQSCPYFGDNKSPMHVSLHKSDDLDTDLPHGYVRNEAQLVCTLWTPNKTTPAMLTPVLHNKIYGAYLLEGSEDLVFKAMLGGVERTVQVTLDQLSSNEGTNNALVTQGLMLHKVGPKALARDFLMAWVDRLHTMKAPKVAADVFGWNADKTTFTYADTIYGHHSRKRAFFRDKTSFEPYQPCGKLEEWKAIAKALTDQKRPCMDTVLASSFGAPLVPFTGMAGLLLSAYSIQSAHGKSTALKVAQTVWGHPVTGINVLNDTGNAISKKLAEIRSLPLMWDELKMQQEIDEFVKLLFRLTQGRDKARLTREVKARVIGSFSTMLVCGTNESLAEAMGRQVGSTEAGANRVFEIDVDPLPASADGQSSHWSQMLRRLESHYGRAGEVYADWLANNSANACKVVETAQTYFETATKAKPDERFWIATMASVYAGATFANGLQLTTIDVNALETFLIEQLDKQRSTRKESVYRLETYDDALGLVHRLIAQTFNRNLLVTEFVTATAGRPVKNSMHGIHDKLQHVWAQLGMTDDILRVVRADFDEWLRRNKLPVSQVYRMLTQHLNGQSRKATIGAGIAEPGLAGVLERGQAPCFEVTLPSMITQQAAAGATAASPLHSSSLAIPPGSPSSTSV
jgi:hypothetical protein